MIIKNVCFVFYYDYIILLFIYIIIIMKNAINNNNKMISSDGACNSRAYVAAATGSPLHGIAFPLRFFAVERFASGLFGW